MNKLESVKAKIVEAVPEIMEIKIGCVLNLHAGESYGWMTVHQMTTVCKKHKKFREECGMEENGCTAEEAVFGTSGTDEEWWIHTVKVADVKPYQIVGRPITLADVFRAINIHCGGWLDEVGSAIAVTQNGGMWSLESIQVENGWTDYPYKCHWNLAENLDNQSEEVIDFLANILLPNNT